MDELIEILMDVKDDVDYENCKSLVDDHQLTSIDIIEIVVALSDEYDIKIPPADVIPENFNSVEAIYAMIQKLLDE